MNNKKNKVNNRINTLTAPLQKLLHTKKLLPLFDWNGLSVSAHDVW